MYIFGKLNNYKVLKIYKFKIKYIKN